VAYQYRAVTLGGTRASAAITAATISGERLRPLAPVNLRRSRDAGDLLISWTRRTRLSTRFAGPLGANAPLGEAAESYEVDIYTSAGYTTVARTIEGLSEPEAVYTAAQQTTDFGSPQATVYARVYQVSAIVGRGRHLQGAL
jgi:hypothetical protein